MHVCVLFVLFLFAYLFYFHFSVLFFLLSFTYLLPSRISTRSVSRPEVVGGDRTWVWFVCIDLVLSVFFS